jgi:HEPN domain-containing protein
VREQARWWLRTAEGDLDAARILLDAGRFNLCAFHAQQAAEKALKAVLAQRGKAHRGHSALELLGALEVEGVRAGPDAAAAARLLDLHYVQSRYPNGLGGDPTLYYDQPMAEECLDHAQLILRFTREHLSEPS